MRRLALMLFAACYNPQLDPCEVHCTGPDDTCPDGTACSTDLRCHAPDDPTLCTTTQKQVQVKVNKLGGGDGDVTSADGEIACGSACTETVAAGSPVMLTARPSVGVVFSGWGGDCSGSDDCSFTASADSTVNATFDITELVTVTFSGNGIGGVMSDPVGLTCDDNGSGDGCSASFVMGTTLVLTPVEIQGQFNGWSGDCPDVDFTCTVQVTGPLDIDLDFE